MPSKILTPTNLWQGFDDSLPLKTARVKESNVDNVSINYVYFSGRQLKDGRVRIFGVYAEVPNAKASILILPDVKNTVDIQIVIYFAKLGYNVLSIDLCGESDGVEDYTKYPNSIKYANYNFSGRAFDHADISAIETSWYEWVAASRYAISFLKDKNPNLKVGVMGIKYGSNLVWQLAATDKRVDCAVCLFGAGWFAYQNIDVNDDSKIKFDDERYRFIAGVDAHSYASLVECPILYLGATNSIDFNAERAVDTLSRVKNHELCYMNLNTYAVNILDFYALKDVELFFEAKLNKLEKKLPKLPEIEISTDRNDVIFNVKADMPSKIEKITLYISNDDSTSAERVWYNAGSAKSCNNGVYTFSFSLFGNTKSVIAFACIKYDSGFNLSSKFAYKKINLTNVSNLPNVLFSSIKLPSSFLVENVDFTLFGDVFSIDKLYDIVEGPCGILGIETQNKITTYAIKKIANTLSDDSFIKFDLYLKYSGKFEIELTDKGGHSYYYSLRITGEECWQNIQVELGDFKDENSISIKNFSDINSLSLSSLGKFMFNNFIVL